MLVSVVEMTTMLEEYVTEEQHCVMQSQVQYVFL
jgi:hypothetical protein